jgi:hypothetical protein
LYRFGPSDTDIGLLAALGLIASQAGGPFVGAGDPGLAGDDASALQGWNALRHSEAAPWIGLAAPRVLLRLPYAWRVPLCGWIMGRIIGPLAGYDKRVRENLARILPDMAIKVTFLDSTT